MSDRLDETDRPPPRLRRVEVVSYDPAWPSRFAEEAHILAAALGLPVAAFHHIGSTSVPGLSAKPIIDMLLEVPRVEALDGQTAVFANLGYAALGEFGIPCRRLFIKGGDIDRTHHIHAFAQGDPHATRHIAFRDYLRAHPQVARAYADLKQALARSCNHDIQAYMDGKDGFIKHYEIEALRWRAAAAKQEERSTGQEAHQ